MALSTSDHARISDAIASAERSTSGEIFCVLAGQTDDYRAVPFAWAALVAIALAPMLLWFGLAVPDTVFSGGWSTGSTSDARLTVLLYAMLSVVLFVATFLLVRVPAIRRRLTPPSLKRAAVHRAAMESFLSHGIHVTEDRTGVLIFMSSDDHVAEVVADESIHSRVDSDVWGAAISALIGHAAAGRLADGFVEAIGICGSVLAQHFPPRPRNPNELPDKLIEI